MSQRSLLILGMCSFLHEAEGQLVVDQTQTPVQLVQNVLLGSGVAVSNITFNGGTGAVPNDQISFFNGTASNIGIPSGVMLASGGTDGAIGPNVSGSFSTGPAVPWLTGDPDLQQIIGPAFDVNDAAILEFDFVPNGDTLRFSFVFASEEYNEFACTVFNDAFGFFISGPGFAGPYTNGAENVALIPATNIPVAINSVNLGVAGSAGGDPANCAAVNPNWTNSSVFFTDNTGGQTVECDGFTVPMEVVAEVTCGQQYHIKIAIADASDAAYDSYVFLEAGSFTSNANVAASLVTFGLNDSTLYEGCATAVLEFERFGDLSAADTVDVIVGGTATNGVDYLPAIPPQIIFPPGDSIITLNLYAPLDPDGIELVDLELQNLANCSGQLVTSYFAFNIDEALDLYITVQDTAIDCGDTITIGPQVFQGYGLYNYVWNTGDTTATLTVSPGVTTTYVVTVSDTCGMPSQTDSIMVTVPYYAPLDLLVSNDTAISCQGSADLAVLQLTGGNGVYQYAWSDALGTVLSNGPVLNVTAGPSTTYYIDVQDGCGFTASDSVHVDPLPLPPVVVNTNSDTTVLCPGDAVDVLVASINGGNGVYTYTWTDGQQAFVSMDSLFNVVVNDTLQFTVLAEDQCGNWGVDSIEVRIPQYGPLVVQVVPDTAICLGTEGFLAVVASAGAGEYSYLWSTGDTLDMFQVAPIVNTAYSVMVTDQCGSIAGGGLVMDVQDITAGFTLNYTGDYDVTFFNTSGPAPVQFLWDFGDGGTSSVMHPGHTYLDTEEHVVQLTVWNPIGCVDSTTALVRPTAHLYVPNAFTPDGDG
ncbi:MAG: choice-of-anchor L domain-containing protein, partial [Flavobacteriales bacterium]|nr:choice-of-anchor L domain-containing protein [Flavobacteriales bacterium]